MCERKGAGRKAGPTPAHYYAKSERARDRALKKVCKNRINIWDIDPTFVNVGSTFVKLNICK